MLPNHILKLLFYIVIQANTVGYAILLLFDKNLQHLLELRKIRIDFLFLIVEIQNLCLQFIFEIVQSLRLMQ